MSVSDFDFQDQVRGLLDIEDHCESHGYVGPADLVVVTRKGRPWGAVPGSLAAWFSCNEMVRSVADKDRPSRPIDNILDRLDGGSPIKFEVVDTRHGDVKAWYNARFLAGLVALHGPPTHSVLMDDRDKVRSGPALVWRSRGHLQSALMPVRRAKSNPDHLADLYLRYAR